MSIIGKRKETETSLSKIDKDPFYNILPKRNKIKKKLLMKTTINNLKKDYGKQKKIDFQIKFNDFREKNKDKIKEINKLYSTKIESCEPNSFGNYHYYSSKRFKTKWEDERLNFLSKSYFLNKRVLDIGCNEGIDTILISLKYSPRIILGIDIDYRLINLAIKNLNYLQKKQKKGQLPHLLQEILNYKSLIQNGCYAKSSQSSFSLIIGRQKFQEINSTKLGHFDFDNICFRQENYISDLNYLEQFDTIICLSTSKWIHLNYGDVGIMILFYKVFSSLSLGGHFIFEPQNWKSYKKKYNISLNINKNYHEIKIRPSQFVEILTNDIGFEFIEEFHCEKNKIKGFHRTMYIFRKPLY